MKKFCLLLVIFNVAVNYASVPNDSLMIFKKNRQFVYRAFYIDSNNDTLTEENIFIKSLGVPWEYQKSQIKYTLTYFPTDSVLETIKKATIKKRKKWEPVNKAKTVTSGLIETSKYIWMHPFRHNQYLYTELAPFPSVNLDSLIVGKSWDGGVLFILSGWGKFKGRVHSCYEVVKQTDYFFMDTVLTDCWEIKAIGVHNKLGENNLQFIFHKEFGFLQMNYSFYDGVKIVFKLEDILYDIGL